MTEGKSAAETSGLKSRKGTHLELEGRVGGDNVAETSGSVGVVGSGGLQAGGRDVRSARKRMTGSG